MWGRGWARVTLCPPWGQGTTESGTPRDTAGWHFTLLAVLSHAWCAPPGRQGPELVRAPMSRVPSTERGRTVRERLGGRKEGAQRALPQDQRLLSLAGSRGRQSCRCTRAASDIITILIMKGQLLQSSPSPRRRERGMQRRSVSLIPSSGGEECPDGPSLLLHQGTDPEGQKQTRPGPRWLLSLLGVRGSLHRGRVAHGVPSSCSQLCPPRSAGKAREGASLPRAECSVRG